MTAYPNLFISAVTDEMPTSSNMGQGDGGNRTPLQKLTRGDETYAVISSMSIRHQIRDQLAAAGCRVNRTRLHHEAQLAVRYEALPDTATYADDFVMGSFVPRSGDSKKGALNATITGAELPYQNTGALQINRAVALTPYRDDTAFTQAPMLAGSPWKLRDNGKSVLFEREVTYSRFQYAAALAGRDVEKPARVEYPDTTGKKKADDDYARERPVDEAVMAQRRQWMRATVEAIAALGHVGGGRSANYRPMAPESVLIRVADIPAPQFPSYCWEADGRLGQRALQILCSGGLPGEQMILAGEAVDLLTDSERAQLEAQGVTLLPMAHQALALACDRMGW